MKEDPPPPSENSRFGGNYGEKTRDNEMCIGKLKGKSRKKPLPTPTKKHKNEDKIRRSSRQHKL